ncbi:MAG: AI-2E family transporter [Methanobrevibacter sp.]|jgi:predicted PurR-regulated permease PerM|nr:AI-2E family transporter [Candidatus Methanoflexus mossambicus]
MKNKILNNLSSPFFILIILLLISFLVLTPILNTLVLGAIIAYGIRPIAKRINGKIGFSNISIILTIILVLIPILAIFIYFISVLGQFGYGFLTNHDFSSMSSSISQSIQQYLPASLKNSTTMIISSISNIINEILSYVFDYLIDLIKSVPMISLNIFVLFISTFYFTRDGSKFFKYITDFIPTDKKKYFNKMFENIKLVLMSIFYGHFITGVIIGILGCIGYFILGYPYALFLGILTGLLQLIPIIGPWPVYFALFIGDLISGNYIRAIVVLLFGFGLSLSDMYIRPALSGKYADIHPLILLLGFLAGPLIFGITGFILGPLILGVTYAVVKVYKDEKKNP